jgi:prefoldin alpha subunit
MTDEKKQQEIQKLLLQIESNRRQLEALNKQGQLIESAVVEIDSTVEALNALKTTEKGTEMLVSAGSGSFIKVSLKDNENILVGIGAGVSAEKKLPDALQTLNSRKEELRKSLEKIRKTAVESTGRLDELNAMAEKLISEAQSQQK